MPEGREHSPARTATRVGVIRNGRSHRNRQATSAAGADDILHAEPATREALAETLATFAAEGVELLVIDGGDGTVREVLSQAPEAFGTPPLFAVAPSGKTNALALDLGARLGWTAEAAVASARAGPRAVTARAPLEVRRPERPGEVTRGFIFGTGAFARATGLAQTAHAAGLFDEAAVAVTLAAAAGRSLVGGPRDPWRLGEPMSLAIDGGEPRDGTRFMLLASTLERLPLGLKPFGSLGEGLKVLDVDAPPRRLWAELPRILFGGAGRPLSDGYRRSLARALRLDVAGAFVLDGELYPGGELSVSIGPPLHFLVPPPAEVPQPARTP